MPTIKNPNYNPNDPKSLRYIPDPFVFVPKNPVAPISTQPTVSSNLDFNAGMKTSTPSSIPKVPPTVTIQNTPTQPKPVVPAVSSSYVVKGGDSLSKIAAANGTSVAELVKINPQYAQNPNLIIPGQNVKLPGTPIQATAPTTPVAPPVTAPPVQPVIPAEAGNQGGGVIQNTNQPSYTPPPATGNPTTDKSMQDLAKEAGKAGLTLDQYFSLINKQNSPTKAESDAIRNKLGIPDLVDEAYGKPKQTTVDMYKNLYEMSDLKSVKESVKKLDDEIAQKRADLVTASGELLNNPWISQATRSGRLGNLNRIAQADIENTLAQKQQYLDLYDKGISEIESEIKRSVFDTGLDQSLSVDKLNYLITEAEREDQFAQRAVEKNALRYTTDFFANQPQKGAEDFTLGENDTRFDAQGNVIAKGSSGSKGLGEKVEIDGETFFMDEFGNLTKPTIPQKPATPEQIQTVQDKLDLINSIASNGSLDAVVGPYEINRGNWGPIDKADRQYLKGAIDQLINIETLDTLKALKKAGGTLGSITERELDLLTGAATKIKGWEVPGSPGEYAIGEKQFNEELTRIKESAQRLKDAMTGSLNQTQPQTLDQYFKTATPEEKNKILQIKQKYPQYGDAEIMQVLGFNKESQTSKNGTLTPFESSIVAQESGGNYGSVGQVPKGYSEADRALGKYQIVPKYHFAKIGLPNTPDGRQQFLDSPQLQDQLFKTIIADLNKQYNGDQKKVAAAYYGGGAGANVVGTPAGNKPQYAGGKQFPSVNQYVASVMSRLS